MIRGKLKQSTLISSCVARGEFTRALSHLGAKVTRDLSVFFPARDGRQDLMYEQDFGLGPHHGEFARARRIVRNAELGRKERDLLCGYCDLFLGQYERAVRTLEKTASGASDYWPNFLHAAAIWLYGDKLRTRDHLIDALGAIEKAVTAEPRRLYSYVIRAGLRREMEDVPGRLSDARRVCRMSPNFVWAHTELAEVLSEEGRYRPALKEANHLIRRFPDRAWSWAQRARMRGISGYYKLALKDFDKAIELDPENGPLYAWRGETKRRLGRHHEAVRDQDIAIAKDPGYRLAHVWRGRVRLLLGEYAKAAEDFTRALRIDPREMLALAWRAEAEFKLGEFQKALADYEAVYPAEPRGLWNALLKTGERQENYFLLDAMGSGKRDAAFFEDMGGALGGAPKDAFAWAVVGRAVIGGGGDVQVGIDDLTRAIKLKKSFGWAHMWRGEGYRRLGRHEEALLDLNKATRLRPASLWAFAFRGRVLSALGRHAEALRSFEKLSLSREQRFAPAHVWKGEALWALGRKQEAAESFQRAFLLNGKCKEAKGWFQKTKNLLPVA